MESVKYHFAPQELYILFAVGVACYAITTSRYPSSKLGRFAGWLINHFLVISWIPLALHYVIIVFGLPPVIFIDMSGESLDPRGLHEMSKYGAYYIHIIMIFLFLPWIFSLWKVGYDEQDESSEDDEGVEA